METRKMAKYLFEAKYTNQGTKGLLHEGGTGRRAAIEKAASAATSSTCTTRSATSTST
jgi:hypothetical protein